MYAWMVDSKANYVIGCKQLKLHGQMITELLICACAYLINYNRSIGLVYDEWLTFGLNIPSSRKAYDGENEKLSNSKKNYH